MIYARIHDMNVIPDNRKEYAEFLLENEGKTIVIKKEKGIRTTPQNRAIHVFFELVAKELADAGHSFEFKIGDKEVELDWTPSLVKECMWKPIQKALLGKKSTTELTKVGDIDLVYDHINRFLGEKLNIHVPFPHEEKVEGKIEYPSESLTPSF